MSNAMRPKIAALIGAASLSVAASGIDELDERRSEPGESLSWTAGLALPAEPIARHFPTAEVAHALEEASSLRDLLAERLERAAERGRHNEIDELATLWMTLAGREQLDRIVERGDAFLNVALRHQRCSEHRAEARVRRVALVDHSCLERSTIDPEGAPCEDDLVARMDAERFVSGLAPRHRDAVRLSLEGLNHREIAERMGVSHAAARKWAQRLRDELDRDDVIPS
jgi:hypothetical protein